MHLGDDAVGAGPPAAIFVRDILDGRGLGDNTVGAGASAALLVDRTRGLGLDGESSEGGEGVHDDEVREVVGTVVPAEEYVAASRLS